MKYLLKLWYAIVRLFAPKRTVRRTGNGFRQFKPHRHNIKKRNLVACATKNANKRYASTKGFAIQ